MLPNFLALFLAAFLDSQICRVRTAWSFIMAVYPQKVFSNFVVFLRFFIGRCSVDLSGGTGMKHMTFMTGHIFKMSRNIRRHFSTMFCQNVRRRFFGDVGVAMYVALLTCLYFHWRSWAQGPCVPRCNFPCLLYIVFRAGCNLCNVLVYLRILRWVIS